MLDSDGRGELYCHHPLHLERGRPPCIPVLVVYYRLASLRIFSEGGIPLAVTLPPGILKYDDWILRMEGRCGGFILPSPRRRRCSRLHPPPPSFLFRLSIFSHSTMHRHVLPSNGASSPSTYLTCTTTSFPFKDSVPKG